MSDLRKAFERPFIDSIMRDMMYGDETRLFKFAMRLDEYCRRVKAKKGIRIVRRAEKWMDLLEECNQKRNKIIEEIIQMGIDMDDEYDRSIGYFGFLMNVFSYENALGNKISMLMNHNEANANSKFTQCNYFNGIFLTEEMLNDPDSNVYRDEYERRVKENEGLLSEREVLYIEIEEKEEKLKRTLFHKKEIEAEIIELKRRLKTVEIMIADEMSAKRKYNTFNKLTSEQESKIIEYMKMTKKMRKIASVISRLGLKFQEEATIQENEYDIDTVTDGFDYMVQKDGMTEKDIQAIFRKINKVAIRRNRGDYDFNDTSRRAKYPTYSDQYKKLKGVMLGFIRYIYESESGDGSFVHFEKNPVAIA